MLRKAYYAVHKKSEYNHEFWPHGRKGLKIIELYLQHENFFKPNQ